MRPKVEFACVRWSAKSLFPAFGGVAPAMPVGDAVLQAAPVERLVMSGDGGSPLAPAAPVTTYPPAAESLQAASSMPAPDSPPRVLLAEDHPVNRKVVELILAALKAEITVAENGAEAVQAYRHGVFDVVLMDMQMPVMDGLTATRAIRHLEATTGGRRTPILSLTANAMPEHVQASMDAGADAHLTKPVSAAGLIEAVKQAQARGAVAPELRRAG